MIKSMTGFGRAEMTFDDLYEVKKSKLSPSTTDMLIIL